MGEPKQINVGGTRYNLTNNKEQEMKMYPDNELTACPTCEGLGLLAPNIWGKVEFYHKVPSTLDGYFTFTATHKN